MYALLNSVVQVERLDLTSVEGLATYDWSPVPGLLWVPCRLDLTFLRPGRDAPLAVEAGVAPSRTGVCFTDPDWDIRAGDRLRTRPDEDGSEPVRGVFELRSSPDVAQAYAYVHHLEFQVVEVSQALVAGGSTTSFPAPAGVVNPEDET